MAPRPTTPRLRPDSRYTDEVRQGGINALRDARQRMRYGASNADVGQQYSQTPDSDNDMYDQWLGDLRPKGYEPTFGRTEEGAYSGFKTEGGLKAAVLGRAETRRDADRAKFHALDRMSTNNLDQIDADYTKLHRDAMLKDDWNNVPEPTAATNVSGWNTLGGQNPMSAAAPTDAVMQATLPEVLMAGRRADPNDPLYDDPAVPGMPSDPARKGGGGSRQSTLNPEMVKREYGDYARDAYMDDLDPWLAEQSGKYLDRAEFAEQGLNTPISEYGKAAGADYGVDADMVAGWYNKSDDIADYRNQRDLDLIDATGMPNADYEQALSAMERQQAADETANDRDDQESIDFQINDAAFQATGGLFDADSLATALDVSPIEAANVVASEAYQNYSYEIASAMDVASQTGDASGLSETMTMILNETQFKEPAIYKALQAVYGDIAGGVDADYIPSEYDVYGGV